MLTRNGPPLRAHGDNVIPPALIAWLAGPPALRSDPESITALVESLLEVLKPYGVRSVWSSEPRIYRPGSRGRALLAEAIAAKRVDSLIFDSGDARGRAGSALAHLHLGSLTSPDMAVSLALAVRPAPNVVWQQIVTQVTTFICKWFVRLSAGTAFVSTLDIANNASRGDSLNQTAYENERRLILVNWSESRRYARGVFWGMGLGREMCEHLGGQERVLQEAPVFLMRPLADGVWLQLSESPPAEQSDLERLSAYLKPLLEWDVKAILARRPLTQVGAAEPPRSEVPPMQVRDESQAPERWKTVPLQVLTEFGTDAGLNVYLDDPLNPRHLQMLSVTLDSWYQEGSNGAFGDGNFHDLRGPSVDGAVVRWHIDFGSADQTLAVRSLAERLAMLSNIKIIRLVVGTEFAQ